MYVCVINNLGEKVFHKNMTCTVENLEIINNTFGNDIVFGVECIFTWYWIADFCSERNIDFALGHALYMAAIYKGKTKSCSPGFAKKTIVLRTAESRIVCSSSEYKSPVQY